MPVTTPLGDVRHDDGDLVIVYTREHAAPVGRVWETLTAPDLTERWIGRWTGDPATGTVRLAMSAEGDAGADEPVGIEACDPPHRLSVTTTGPAGTWRLLVTLADDHGTTRLTLAHRSAGTDDPSSVGPGWHFYLDRLDAVVRGETPPDDWDDYYPALADAYRG